MSVCLAIFGDGSSAEPGELPNANPMPNILVDDRLDTLKLSASSSC